jgi:hypothetical protein
MELKMKKLIVIMAVTWIALGTVNVHALTPKEIITKIDGTERVASSEGMARQIITTSGGKKRTLEFKSFSKDRNDKQLVIYTAPKRVKGDACVTSQAMLGDRRCREATSPMKT